MCLMMSMESIAGMIEKFINYLGTRPLLSPSGEALLRRPPLVIRLAPMPPISPVPMGGGIAAELLLKANGKAQLFRSAKGGAQKIQTKVRIQNPKTKDQKPKTNTQSFLYGTHSGRRIRFIRSSIKSGRWIL